MISLILLVIALVLFVLATIGAPSSPRFNLTAAGLACLAGHLLAAILVQP